MLLAHGRFRINMKMIRTTQRKMLRFISQSTTKNRKKVKRSNEEKKTGSDEEPTNDLKKQKKTIAAQIPKERQKKATAQTQIATKIAKSHS